MTVTHIQIIKSNRNAAIYTCSMLQHSICVKRQLLGYYTREKCYVCDKNAWIYHSKHKCRGSLAFNGLPSLKQVEVFLHFHLLSSWLHWCKWKAVFSFCACWVIAQWACPLNCPCQAYKSWKSPHLSITCSLFLHNPISCKTIKQRGAILLTVDGCYVFLQQW